MREKQGVVKFVKTAKRLFLVFSVIAIPAEMVVLVFAFMGFIGCIIIACVLGVGYIVVYGAYALRVSMGAVIAIQVTDQVVHLKTKRKTWTYDAKRGCVDMKVRKNKFIGVFQTQDSRDSFIFYKKAPFTSYSDEQFTEEGIRRFYTQVDDLIEEE